MGKFPKVTPFPFRTFGQLRRVPRLLAAALIGCGGIAVGAAGMALLHAFGAAWPTLVAGGMPRQSLNAQRVYDRLAPSVLDITANLRYDDETAEGTGFVFDSPRDLVLTNNHVVKDATSVTATLVATGKTYRARVVGTDTTADIAVLQLDHPPRLAAAPMASSGAKLGEDVLVIGNQGGQGGPPTIAPGIINSLDRTIEATDGSVGFTETLRGMLQTSARIEPGDSGGPLADSGGQVVGVDTATTTGAGAAGFAIPIGTALAAARQIAAGRPGPGITLGARAFLGVLMATGAPAGPQAQPQSSLTDRGAWDAPAPCLATESEAAAPEHLAPIRYGALVEGVLCGTPAAASGLTAGDMIIRAAGRSVPSPGALRSIVAGCGPGTELPVTWVGLDGAVRTALIRLTAGPVA
ncbi:MAG: trypsin-like peptidase domain-containing protein [Nocardiopsaceae bacterium]|nr:trypsin-like peptidase domain-containing protein [Nocardiopsaceae bacterium]